MSRQAARSAAAAAEQEAAATGTAPTAEATASAAAAATATGLGPQTAAMPSSKNDEIATIALAAERALRDLDAAIASSLELSEMSEDPASAQVVLRPVALVCS